MKINRRKLILVITGVGLLLLSLSLKSPLATDQNWGPQPAWAVDQGSAAAAEHTEEHHGAPVIYYIDWLLLIITLFLVWSQVKKRLKKPAEHTGEAHAAETHAAPAGAGIPVFLIGLVVFIFLTESLSAVAHYHEPVRLGLLHLLIKLATGVLLMLYGLSFMHEH